MRLPTTGLSFLLACGCWLQRGSGTAVVVGAAAATAAGGGGGGGAAAAQCQWPARWGPKYLLKLARLMTTGPQAPSDPVLRHLRFVNR